MSTIHDYRNNLAHYWSQSRVNLFLTCSLKYAFSYVYKVQPEFEPSALAFGSAVHNCLTLLALHQKDGHPLDAGSAEDLFSTIWQRQLTEDRPLRFKESESGDSMLEKGRKIIGVFHQNMPGDGDRILSVAEALAVPVIDQAGAILTDPLIAEMDVLVAKPDGSKVIRDWKTASRKRTDHGSPETNADTQVLALSYAFMQQYGELPSFEYQVVTKTDKPAFQVVKAKATVKGMQRLIETIKVIDRGVKNDCFLPADGCWACSDCQFGSACKRWTTNQTAAISIARKAA